MLAYLSGKVISQIGNNLIVKLSSGAGYKVEVLSRDIASLELGKDVELLIVEIIKEDRDDLYGFINRTDLECFEKLITVSGVGSKMAINVLDSYTPDQLALILESSDLKSLQNVSGVGKKLASKIILELKGDLVINQPNEVSINNELKQALSQMGFKSSEISTLDTSKFSNLSTVEQLKLALQQLNKQ